jgi:hypothetical protein
MQGSVRGKLESVLSKAGKYYSSVAHFERMWWDKGSDARKHVSIWRPVVSTGYAMLGDFVTDGYVGCSWFLASFNWQQDMCRYSNHQCMEERLPRAVLSRVVASQNTRRLQISNKNKRLFVEICTFEEF